MREQETKMVKEESYGSMGTVYLCPSCSYSVGNSLVHIPLVACPRCLQKLRWKVETVEK